MKLKILLSVALLASIVMPSFAQESTGTDAAAFLDRKGEGWFWYQDPKEVEKKDPQPASAPVAAAPAKPAEKPGPQPFSVEWLRKEMPKLLDEAIDDPTKENVEAYLYAQHAAMDKSQRYAEMTQQVVATDPYLDENNRVPLDSLGKAVFRRGFSADNDAAMKYISQIGGLWLFMDSKCSYCQPQADTVQHIAKKYGIAAKFISMDGKGLPNVPDFVRDNGTAHMLNLKLTPTTVLVVPPNNYYIVSQGMMAQDQLEDRIITAVDANDLFPPELAKKIHTFDRGVLTTNDMKDGASDDPKVWVKYLKDRLQGRY
jgi:conjugal transfer pilus assembly protein TraF